MKHKIHLTLMTIAFALSPVVIFAQAPELGTSANFVLFSTNGAVSNTGTSHLTGNVGTNSGSSTDFGNVDGQMHDNDLASAAASADVLIAYGDLNSAIPTFFPGPLLGDGIILTPGVYSIPSAATLNLDLILDGGGDPDALFIFQIEGAFSTNANSKVKLINDAQACNVFWKVEGLVNMSAGTTMRGTVLANNAAIVTNVGDTLEGRLLTISGAITVDGIFAYTPIGCGSPVLTGPIAPDLLSTDCYGIFSGNGSVSNAGITYVTGDVGTNVGLTTGFDALNVTGMIHPIPDVSTASAAADLLTIYNYLNILPADIELLYPPLFGNNLVLTPHTYVMNSAVTFTDTVFLNAQGNSDAVFVFQINGAFSTSTFSKVVLINGTKVENVFWKIDGAVDINDYSVFKGTIVCNNGAINLNTGVSIDGRVMTTDGALGTATISTSLPTGCLILAAPTIVSQPINDTTCITNSANFIVIATGTALTYQWRKGVTNLVDDASISGSNSAILHFSNVGVADFGSDYNVVVSGSGGPSVTSDNAELILCEDLGMHDVKLNSMASIFPNPFTNNITIYLTHSILTDYVEIKLFNLLGEGILTSPIIGQTTFIDVSELPKGMYTYRIVSESMVIQTGKIISNQ
jgi:hypothetical protein